MTFDADSVLTVLIVQSARAAVLILAILFLRTLLGKRIPPAWRHAIWGLVPLQLLLVVSIPSSISMLNVAKSLEFGVWRLELKEPEVERSETFGPTTESVEFGMGSLDLKEPEVERSETFGPTAESVEFGMGRLERKEPEVERNETSGLAVQSYTSQSDAAHSPPHTPSPTHILMTVWGVGCLVMIVVFVRQIMRCRRWIARGKPVTSEPVLQLFEESCRRMKIKTWLVVAESSMVRSPFLIGAIRPKLLLPRRMVETASPKQLHAVFLHELAHLKRWDIWTGWLMTLLLIVHWFNPLLWLAIRRMNADREEACDVMAMNTLDRLEQGDYAHALLDIVQQFLGSTYAPGLVGISETGKFLKRRIDMLKQIGTWKLRWKVLALGLALLIAAVTLTDAQEKKEVQSNPGNIVIDGVEYAPVIKDELKPQPRQKESRSIAGRYESETAQVELIAIMSGVYKINLTKKSDMFEGMASRNDDQMRIEFLSYQKMHVISVDGNDIPEVRQGPVPDTLQSLTIDIKQDENGTTSLAFPETDQWKAFEVSIAEPDIVPRDLNGGFRGTLDGKTFVIDLIAAYDPRKTPPNLEYSVNVYYSGLKRYSIGTAVIQEKELKLEIPLPQEVPELQQKPHTILLSIDKDDSGQSVLTVKSDAVLKNFPSRFTKITTNDEWQEIEQEWETQMIPSAVTSENPKPSESQASMIQKDIGHMKQLGLALHNYHDAFKSLPSASTANKDGKPMHSWRVALLPFVERVGLYEKIRHNEPWDSEYNRQFHNQMPDVFRSPFLSDADANNGLTLYAVVVNSSNRMVGGGMSSGGMGAMGMGGGGMSDGGGMMSGDVSLEPVFAGPNQWRGWRHVPDGTSNTVAFVMRARPVCWMDPNSDIPFEIAIQGLGVNKDGLGAQTIPELSEKPITPITLCDGSVQLVSADISQDILRAMLTCAGGEALHWDDWLVNPDPKIAITYELPPSVDPTSVLKIIDALLGENLDTPPALSSDHKKIRFQGRTSDHEKMRMLLGALESAEEDLNAIPPQQVDTVPTPSDLVPGKYLATRVDGRKTGLELTRLDDTDTGPTPQYRIVMYDDVSGLSGHNFSEAENQHRVIGTAIREGNKLAIECEVEHDGERYTPVRTNLVSGKIVQDGKSVILVMECEIRRSGGGTDFFAAEKVQEEESTSHGNATWPSVNDERDMP